MNEPPPRRDEAPPRGTGYDTRNAAYEAGDRYYRGDQPPDGGTYNDNNYDNYDGYGYQQQQQQPPPRDPYFAGGYGFDQVPYDDGYNRRPPTGDYYDQQQQQRPPQEQQPLAYDYVYSDPYRSPSASGQGGYPPASGGGRYGPSFGGGQGQGQGGDRGSRATNNPANHPELVKTRMCRSITAGIVCRFGDQCTFAHSQDEMRRPEPGSRPPPQQQQPRDNNYPPPSQTGGGMMQQRRPAQTSMMGGGGGAAVAPFGDDQQNTRTNPTWQPHLKKTKLCRFFETRNGDCPFGDKCNFAHGSAEIQAPDPGAFQQQRPPQGHYQDENRTSLKRSAPGAEPITIAAPTLPSAPPPVAAPVDKADAWSDTSLEEGDLATHHHALVKRTKMAAA